MHLSTPRPPAPSAAASTPAAAEPRHTTHAHPLAAPPPSAPIEPIAIDSDSADSTEEDPAPRARRPRAVGWLTAAQRGDAEAARTYANIATIDQPDGNGCTPLSRATQKGHHDVMRVLIQRGAAVDKPCKIGYTPLIWAAQEGDAEACAILLNAHADHGHASKEGWTALMWAAARGNVPIIELLLKHGALVDFYAERKTEQFPPLYIAAQEDRFEAVKALVAAGANVAWRDRRGRSARDAAPEGAIPAYLAALMP